VFWFASLIALPVAGLVALLAPTQVPTPERAAAPREKVRRLDLPGVALVTAGLLLFIFGVTEGSTVGWTSAEVLAPLIVAVVLLLPAFFLYERAVPAQYAAVYVLWLRAGDVLADFVLPARRARGSTRTFPSSSAPRSSPTCMSVLSRSPCNSC
jgi:lysylphosphatidylglycerol synthetase-like protein (DUF2156 family)